MKPAYLLLLLAAQTVWAASYIAMKIGLQSMPPLMVVFLRYFFVLCLFIPFWIWKGFPKVDIKLIIASLIVGGANFYGSPILQAHALKYTQATDVSFLILIEPMLTVLMAMLILKEKVSANLWKVLGLSMLGFVLISDIRISGHQEPLTKLRVFGNLLFFGSLFFEALCSVTGKYFTKKNKPWDAMGLLMACGVMFCMSLNANEIISFEYASISTKSWLAILFLSVGCSIFAYCTWYFVIEKVPVQFVALSLFLQPVVASILGYAFLDEVITLHTIAGGAIIVAALIWWQSIERVTAKRLAKKLENQLL